MYEIIAIERKIEIGTDLITVRELYLYVKLGHKQYYPLRSMFSKFNKKRLTRKLLNRITTDNVILLVYPELPEQSNIIYRYEV